MDVMYMLFNERMYVCMFYDGKIKNDYYLQ